MAKPKSRFVCLECGYETAKWMGKCSDCGAWNSLQEKSEEARSSSSLSQGIGGEAEPKRISEVESEEFERRSTGMKEFDRVLGGGAVKGSLTLLGGEPGVGKSTLLMEVCSRFSQRESNCKILYVSGEESLSQIAARGKRLGVRQENFYLVNETSWQSINDAINRLKPDVFVLDSIQTTQSGEVLSGSGSAAQVREVTYELMNVAKSRALTCFIIGHVTKDGAIAGPKLLEHMVDTVVYFEGDVTGQFRMLRGIKNRFGNTNEVGVFEMGETGLREVANPSEIFSDGDNKDSFGRSLACVVEGTRPLVVEAQALVVENKYGSGRRVTQGIDGNRLALLVAIVDKYFGIPLSARDIYVNIVGGLRLSARDSDLAVLASLLSSFYGVPMGNSTVFVGEVGLTGEVRPSGLLDGRLREIERLGYKQVILSERAANEYAGKFGLELVGIRKAPDLKGLYL